MSFQFMPFFTGDYLRDTRHLTPMKHGVYTLLLMNCWDQKGPAPLDEQELAGITNCRSADEIDALRYVLKRYFIQMDDGWYNKRMQAEVEKAENISNSRSNAGKRGYEAKLKALNLKESQASAKQVLSNCLASASTPTPTPTTTTTTTTTKDNTTLSTSVDDAQEVITKAKATATHLHEDARAVLAFLNTKRPEVVGPVRGFSDKTKANLADIKARLRDGASVSDCKKVIANRIMSWQDNPDMHQYLTPQTLFRAKNFAKYIASLPVMQPQGDLING